MKKKIALLIATLLLTILAVPSTQAFQDDDSNKMVSGFKMKTRENGSRKLDVNVKIDENENNGSLSIGSSNNISGVVRYCKSRRRKSCPEKYL